MARKSHLRLVRDGHTPGAAMPVPVEPFHSLDDEYTCAECGSTIPAGLVHLRAVDAPALHFCTRACAQRVPASVRLAATKRAKFATGEVPATVRLSTLLRKLRTQGKPLEAKAIEQLHASVGDRCPKHGRLADPVVGLLTAPITTPYGQSMIAFACPWCSSPQVREAWEAEGRQA